MQATGFQAVVIGAGVVGLAVGRSLAAAGLETVVVERNTEPGAEISSRNSGVIHSGIYYSPGSLKASMCVRGSTLLREYCRSRDIRHRICGKLIVAQDRQVAALHRLKQNGLANGVRNLRVLDAGEVRSMEPEVRCAIALHSPDTGILDVHELMLALRGDLEASGGAVVLRTEVTGIRPCSGGFELETSSTGIQDRVTTTRLVNCAGLAAIDVTRLIAGYPAHLIPDPRFAKGSYFACSANPFARLVYPMPDSAGLGIHATLGLDGSLRFGPDVEWVNGVDYEVDPGRASLFAQAIQQYWPGLPNHELKPDFAGVRPKIVGPGEPPADFIIHDHRTHGIPMLINLLGIESPGITAALAIGEHVSRLLLEG